MQIEVDIDEADVGQVRVRPAGDLHGRGLPGPGLSRRATELRYRARDGRRRRDLYRRAQLRQFASMLLRPGMTATAEIVVAAGRRRAAGAQRRPALRAAAAAGGRGRSGSLVHADPPQPAAERRGRRRSRTAAAASARSGSCATARAGRCRCASAPATAAGPKSSTARSRRRRRVVDRGRQARRRRWPTPPPRRRRPLIELPAGHPDLWPGRRRGPRPRRRRPRDRRGRVRRDHGAERLGQVDGDEHPRLPRYADSRRLPVQGRRGRQPDPRPAGPAAPPLSRLRLPGLQPARPHLGAGERRTAADLPRHARRPSAARSRWRRWPRSGCRPRAPRPERASGRPAAARRDRPRHRHRAPPSCWPTSPPAISTPRAAARSWSC